MQYNPKLKVAMEKIKAILAEDDIAAFVVLHLPGHSEYLNRIDTKYSAATLHPEGIQVRIKQAEIGKEKAQELAEGTYNMITHFVDIMGPHTMLYMDCHDALKKKLGGTSGPGSHTGHTDQNN